MVEYDINALREAIKKAEVNIQTFEDAIEGERATQREYRRMISVLEDKLNGNDNSKT